MRVGTVSRRPVRFLEGRDRFDVWVDIRIEYETQNISGVK